MNRTVFIHRASFLSILLAGALAVLPAHSVAQEKDTKCPVSEDPTADVRFSQALVSDGLSSITLSEEAVRRKFDYYYYEALNAKALGKYDAAIDLFRHCHSLDSANAAVLAELGTFYHLLQEKNKALEFFRKAVAQDTANYYYEMMLAGLCKELNLKQEVVDIYRSLSQRHPDKLELRFELANACAENGSLQEAVDILNAVEKQIGISEMITFTKFRFYSMMEQKEKAFDEIRQIIEKNPDDPRYPVLMGDLYMEDNQPEKALPYYEKVKKTDPNFPALIYSMINYYEKTDDKPAAQTELRKAIETPSVEVEDKLQLLARYLAMLQQSGQDMNRATTLFDKLFEQYPNNSQLNMLYGNLLLMQKDAKGAMEQFAIFTRSNPGDPTGYEQMIRVAVQEEDYKTIISVATEALKHLPSQPQFYFYLGGAYYQEKEYHKALHIFEEGLEKAVIENPMVASDFYGQIGDLNYFLEKKEVAFEKYEKALQLNPQNLPVLNNYSYYLSLEGGNLDKAEQMSGITIKAEPMNATYLDTYGWILYEQGSYMMAKIYIEKAIEYGKESPSADVHEHYGDVLFRTGEPEKALEQWKRAKELGSDSKVLDQKIRTGKL